MSPSLFARCVPWLAPFLTPNDLRRLFLPSALVVVVLALMFLAVKISGILFLVFGLAVVLGLFYLFGVSLSRAIHRQWLPAITAFCTFVMMSVCAVVVAAKAILFAVAGMRRYTPDVASFLNEARLATLPSNASNIKTHGWAALFTGEQYMTFTAPRSDIDAWLTRCKDISNQTPTTLPSDLTHAPFLPDDEAPRWFKPSPTMTGRMFEIPPDASGHYQGSIIIDDDRNEVYIDIIWS